MAKEKLILNGIEVFVEHENLGKTRRMLHDPLIMVHGWTADHFRNYPVFKHLAKKGLPVVCYDLRGHGWSQKNLEGKNTYTLSSAVQDLTELVKHVMEIYDYPSVSLYGHSMGGTIALAYAVYNKITLDRLFLLAPWMKKGASKEMLEVFELLLQGYEKRFEREFKRKKKEQEKLGLEFFPHWEDPTLFPEKNAVIQFGKDMFENDVDINLIKNLDIPVHIIIGTRDRPDLKNTANILHESIPDSTLDVLESGHGYAIERRDIVPKIIEKYLVREN